MNDFSIRDMFSELVDNLKKQAAEPNMHAYEPHPKQKIFHKSQEKARLFIGGNRSGKTAGGVVEDLWWLTRRHPYRRIPSDVAIRGRVLGDGFENGTINDVLIPTFQRWIVPSDLINGSWEDSWSRGEHTLTLANGSFIEFKSYDQDLQKHAGTSRHFVHFDEEPPESVFTESLFRLLDTEGSWWMTMTPLNGMNWVYDDLYLPAKNGELNHILILEVETTDNPYLSRNALAELLGSIKDVDREQRLKGKFSDRGGLVFPEFGIKHMIDGNWYPEGDNYRIFMSIDHGLNNPTAVLWHAVSSDGRVITFGEHYARDMIVKEHAVAIKKFEKEHRLNNIYARPGDPAMKQRQGVTGTSIVQEYASNGIFLNVETIPRDVKTGLDRMRMYMKPDPNGIPFWRIVTSQCPNLTKELSRLVWKTYDSERHRGRANRLEEVKKKDDHTFDSSRYFFTLMPDLSPDAIWKPAVVNSNKPRSYIEVLEEMAERTRWETVTTGSVYQMDGFDA